MSEQACHKAGLHLILCCRALEDKEKMRTAFALLLSVPLNIEDEEKYNFEQVVTILNFKYGFYLNSSFQDSPEDTLIALAIQDDDLHKYETAKRKEAEYCILTAARLIAPYIEETFGEGSPFFNKILLYISVNMYLK